MTFNDFEIQCARCGVDTAWYTVWFSEVIGCAAICTNCYDGAPDSGYRVGAGPLYTDAIQDYNEQNYGEG